MYQLLSSSKSLFMDLFQIVPVDIIMVLLNTIYHSCQTSFIIMSYVNKFFHKYTSIHAKKNSVIRRTLYLEEIASRGYLEVYQWARKFLNRANYGYASHRICAIEAASNGHLELLQWITRSIKQNTENDIRRCTDICTFAAKYRHYRIVTWAQENGFKWTSNVCVYAARDGHLWFLIKAYQNGNF